MNIGFQNSAHFVETLVSKQLYSTDLKRNFLEIRLFVDSLTLQHYKEPKNIIGGRVRFFKSDLRFKVRIRNDGFW